MPQFRAGRPGRAERSGGVRLCGLRCRRRRRYGCLSSRVTCCSRSPSVFSYGWCSRPSQTRSSAALPLLLKRGKTAVASRVRSARSCFFFVPRLLCRPANVADLRCEHPTLRTEPRPSGSRASAELIGEPDVLSIRDPLGRIDFTGLRRSASRGSTRRMCNAFRCVLKLCHHSSLSSGLVVDSRSRPRRRPGRGGGSTVPRQGAPQGSTTSSP